MIVGVIAGTTVLLTLVMFVLGVPNIRVACALALLKMWALLFNRKG